jgi:hypothetical protein
MPDLPVPQKRWHDTVMGYFWRFAAGGYLPAKWFIKRALRETPSAKQGELKLEIVSHCWNYAHFMVHQLSSLVASPPTKGEITMTVFYCPEDSATEALLKYFSAIAVPQVTWNWQPQPKQALFRRAIGRNQTALTTAADWVWFADCDVMFREGCIDALIEQLQGRNEPLFYPKSERCTPLLPSDNSIFDFDPKNIHIKNSDIALFTDTPPMRTRAAGAFQIAHGDYLRTLGYCNDIQYYQRPSNVWLKTYEDRAFRWLMGSQGIPLDFHGVYRIRHLEKGRYTVTKTMSGIRGALRKIKTKLLGA